MESAPDGGGRDPITAAYWNGRFAVECHPRSDPEEARARGRAIFGRQVPDAAWGLLVGAPDDATVAVNAEPGSRPVLRVTVSHAWYDGPAIRYLARDDASRVGIVNAEFHLRPEWQRRGIGTRVLAHQVRAGHQVGVAYLVTAAAGGPGGSMNGYYTWALLGFDQRLPDDLVPRLPARLSDARFVLDLMEDAEGREWWRRNGRAYEGTFSLADGSRSLRVLRAYTVRQGITI